VRGKFIATGFSAFALALAGCAASGGATPAPATGAPPASSAPTDTPAAACAPTTDEAGVTVTILDFTFGPSPVTATVGQPIGWSNRDGAPHTATLDTIDCATGTISANGGTAALVFSEPGEYPYHCAIHPQMKGTIVVN